MSFWRDTVEPVIARSAWWDRLPACLLRTTGKMPVPLAIPLIYGEGDCHGLRPRNDTATANRTKYLALALTKPAPTWHQGWRSGQWHPTSSQCHLLGAIPRPAGGFVRSVLDLNCSSFDRKPAIFPINPKLSSSDTFPDPPKCLSIPVSCEYSTGERKWSAEIPP
jgi:hypothetical protein